LVVYSQLAYDRVRCHLNASNVVRARAISMRYV
jgi:hypothetical protein